MRINKKDTKRIVLIESTKAKYKMIELTQNKYYNSGMISIDTLGGNFMLSQRIGRIGRR